MTFQLDQKEPNITGGRGGGGGDCESKNRKEDSTWLVAELGPGLNQNLGRGVL